MVMQRGGPKSKVSRQQTNVKHKAVTDPVKTFTGQNIKLHFTCSRFGTQEVRQLNRQSPKGEDKGRVQVINKRS